MEEFTAVCILLFWISIHIYPLISNILNILKYKKEKFRLFISILLFNLSLIPIVVFIYYNDGTINILKSIPLAIVMCVINLTFAKLNMSKPSQYFKDRIMKKENLATCNKSESL